MFSEREEEIISEYYANDLKISHVSYICEKINKNLSICALLANNKINS